MLNFGQTVSLYSQNIFFEDVDFCPKIYVGFKNPKSLFIPEVNICYIIGCVIYGIFAGGMPGNGPLVYSEDFQKDLPSAMGIASIGRALAALSMGPVSGMSILMLISFWFLKDFYSFNFDDF